MKSFFIIIFAFLFSSITTSDTIVYGQYREDVLYSNEPKFFAIQHAQYGSIVSDVDASSYSLELNNVSDTTIWFIGKPEKIVDVESTRDFVDNWTLGADSFAKDIPNAVLVVDDLEIHDISITELFNPVYDVDKKILKYNIILENMTSLDFPIEFRHSTLIIDETCVEYGQGTTQAC
ncbi:MAG: hypothetical protein ACE5SW_07655 [Nitrososphaeraceae archaeon]